MKALYRLIAGSFLIVSATQAEELRTLPKYGPNAARMYLNREYLQKNAAPDFWALIPYYVHQQTGSACSIASATMILNAIRAPSELSSSMDLLTQDSVLRLTENPAWSKAVGKKGGGVTLDQLGAYFTQALEKLKLKNWKVEILHADSTPQFQKRLSEILKLNESSDRSFVLINYLQGELTGDPEGLIGHLAPVGAYDSKASKVLILDPDRQYYEPYWSPEASLIRAMNTTDKVSGKTRGLLWIHFSPSLSEK
ncbi:MAG: hypothetical protein KGQ59_02525 [Bdellovibrionales bacterium]|nr:hypothetical protein [Bdellovibrionales bacterium]